MRFGSVCLTTKHIDNGQSQPDPMVLLEYDLIPAKSYDLRSKHADKQFVVIPQLDLSDYSSKTIIDFVELKIVPKNTGLGPKQIYDLIAKAAECKPDVRSLGYNADGNREFKVVVQEVTPSRYFSLRALFKNELELSYPATFLKLEFAIDFYPKTPSVEAFAKMHGFLARSFMPVTSHLDKDNNQDHIRMVYATQSGKVETSHLEPNAQSRVVNPSRLSKKPTIWFRSTIYVGRQDHPFASWRIMHKDRDKQNKAKGTQVMLQEDKQRTRIEVTLGEEGLRHIGVEELNDLETLNFSKALKPFFTFNLPLLTNAMSDAVFFVKKFTTKQRFLNQGIYRLSQQQDERIRWFKSLYGHKLKGGKASLRPMTKYQELMDRISNLLNSATRSYNRNDK